MLSTDELLKTEHVLELLKKQYPHRQDIIRLLVLFDKRNVPNPLSSKALSSEEVIELVAGDNQKILLTITDGRISDIVKK